MWKQQEIFSLLLTGAEVLRRRVPHSFAFFGQSVAGF
jgi:hypothetical protein